MLKSIGAVFLVQNERRECVSSVGLETSFPTVGKLPEVGQARFFSPSQDRQMAAQARYGDDYNARDGVATYPHFGAEQASVGTRMQPPTVGAPPFSGGVTPQQPATMVSPATNGAYSSQGQVPRRPLTAYPAGSLWPPAVPAGEHNVAESPLPGDVRIEEISNLSNPLNTSSDASSDISPLDPNTSPPVSVSDDAESISVASISTLPSVGSAAGQNAAAPAPTSPQQSAEVPLTNEGLRMWAAKKVAEEQAVQRSLELDLLKEQLKAEREQRADEMNTMKQMMQMMQVQLQQNQHAQQAALAKLHETSTYTHTGAEEWIVRERLKNDFEDRYRYWHVTYQRWENASETVLRARVFVYLAKKLPSELHRRVPENDVLSIYHNIVRVNSKPAHSQIVTLTSRVMQSKKGSQPMMSWLDKLYEDVESLEKLNRPMDQQLIRTVIIDNLSGDNRYKLVLNDLIKNWDWPMAVVRAHLESAAATVNDLVPDSKFKKKQAKKVKQQKKRKANKAAKKAAAEEDAKKTADPATGAAPQANAAQLAHGQQNRPKGKGDAPAEGQVTDKQKRDRLRNELCPFFIAGICQKGDSCARRHMNPEQIKEWVAKQRKGKTNQGNDGGKDANKKPAGLGQCYQWEQNGTCDYGDNCRYKHTHTQPVPKANVARLIVNASHSAPLMSHTVFAVGDSVILDATFPHACMYGMVGKIVGRVKVSEGVWLVKLDGPLSRYSDFVQAEANRLYSQGVHQSMLLVVPPGTLKRVVSAYNAFVRNGPSPRSPFSANAICDTGANAMISSVPWLFAWLVAISENNEVSGIGDQPLICTHKGRVTMKFANHERHLIGFYTPSPIAFTIVPASLFDDGKWSFAGQNRTMHFFVTEKGKTQLVGRFPRDIVLDDNVEHPKDFLSSLDSRSKGRALHSLYPLPDKVFVWHKRKPEVRMALAGPTKAPPKPSAALEEKKMPKGEDSGALTPPTPLGPVPGTVYVWASEEDVSSRKVNGVLQGIRDLHDFHTLSGHRSSPTTALQYAWIYGKTHSLEVRNNQRRCAACDEARICDDPFRKEALLTVKIGDEYSVDTIDRMPTSHSGYRYLGHARERASSFGGVFMHKTKAMSPFFLHWLKLVIKMIGRDALRIKVDGGEYLTTDLVAFCQQNGIDIVKNIPHVHSNHAIEARHRPLEEMINAMLREGGANAACWEFCAPTAGFLMNISFNINELRKAGWPAPEKEKERPLTPFEKVVNRGKPIDLRALWDNLGAAMFELVTAYSQERTSHEPRGFQGINFGIIPSEKIAITMHGIYVLRLSDKRIVPCRKVIRHKGIYPWRPSPRRPLPPPDEESVEEVDEEDSDVAPSGGEGVTKLESDSKYEAPTKELEQESDSQPGAAVAPAKQEKNQNKRPRPGRPTKFPPGQEVMTTGGPAIILRRLSDGDYNLRWDGGPEPEEVFSLPPGKFWLVRDWPDYIYDHHGKLLTPAAKLKAAPRRKPFAEVKDDEKSKCELPVRSPLDAPAGRTRYRARTLRAPEMHRYDEKAPNGVKVMQYPLEKLTPSAVKHWLAKRGAFKRPTLPENFPMHPSLPQLRQMLAREVEAVLPRHYHQTLHSPLRPACAEGECRELQDCLNRGVWDRPVLAEGNIIIGLMWVYAIKNQSKDEKTKDLFDRVRSRITLMGNQERNLLDPLDAYAPVAQMVTGRILLASHLHIEGLILRKLDVKNAYINEDMRRVVHTRMPPGYTWVDLGDGDWTFRPLQPGEKSDPRWCLPLVKALYGGMECGRIFWEAWVDWHLHDGFQIIHADRCYLCKRDDKSDSFIKLVYHVDDNLVIAKGEAFYQAWLDRLHSKFDLDEGPLKEHLGVFYTYDADRKILEMNQSVQIGKMLAKFGMEDCKPADAPCLPGTVPTIEDAATEPDQPFDMMSLVGHATWLWQCTRPDIGQVLKILSRCTTSFGQKHVRYAKHLLRYLQGTRNQGLTYKAGFPLYYQVFTDASHASCPDTRRSILSLMVKLGGMTVYWKNMYSKIVSHSSCESELFALDMGATTGQCLRWLLEAVGGPVQGTIQIFVDNQGTINLSTNPVQPGRNLHVHARYFYVRDLVYGEEYTIVYLPTELQLADVGCTFKGGIQFRKLRQYLISTARVVHNDNGTPLWECLHDTQ